MELVVINMLMGFVGLGFCAGALKLQYFNIVPRLVRVSCAVILAVPSSALILIAAYYFLWK